MQHPRYSIFTHSVGYHTSKHGLLSKLDAISAAGLAGVEMFTDDLWSFAQSDEFGSILAASERETELLTPPDSPLSQPASLRNKTRIHENAERAGQHYSAHGACTPDERQREIAAATFIRSYCASRRLQVECLQPLRDVEGWLKDEDRENAIERVKSRFDIMRALDTHLLLICSQNTRAPQTTGDMATIVRDLTHISDLAAAYTAQTGFEIKIGYEALSWGAHIDLWSQAWNIVRTVDRDNIGLILDSFNTLAREFADPCTRSGIQEPICTTLTSLHSSLQAIQSVPADKIFLLQIGDARRLPEPLVPSPRDGEPRPSRMIWSRSSRLMPCETDKGGFMPVAQFVKSVVNAGYSGPWSIEVFNSELEQPGVHVQNSFALRARQGLDRLLEVVFA